MEQEHTPVSVHSWLGRVPMRIRRTARCLSCLHGRTWSSSGAWGDIKSSAKGWRGPFGWPSQKPWSGQWRRCTSVVSALGTSFVVSLGRRSCRWLIFQLWSRTGTQGRRVPPGSAACSTRPGQRHPQRRWGGILHGSCCSRCVLLYFCTAWWCLRHACPGALCLPPSTVAVAGLSDEGVLSSCQPWWPPEEYHRCLGLFHWLWSRWSC